MTNALREKHLNLRTLLYSFCLLAAVNLAHGRELTAAELLQDHPYLGNLAGQGDRWKYNAAPSTALKVLPVFAVATDQRSPNDLMVERLQKHLVLSRNRFREMTNGIDTFEVVDGHFVLKLKYPLSHYRTEPEEYTILQELLDTLRVSRFANPWVFAIAVMNSKDGHPTPGGRTINGGINNGGGYIHFPSQALQRSAKFQSTIEHELGHAFGLLHVDNYGENMNTSPSIMGYNPKHHHSLEGVPEQKATLNARDLYALSRNQRVFEKLKQAQFKPQPFGDLPPMKIPGHPDAEIQAETQAGETYDSRVSNIFKGPLVENTGPCCKFSGTSMWHSGALNPNDAALTVKFPLPISINRILVHSQHSGNYHMAEGVSTRLYLGEKQVSEYNERIHYPDKELLFPVQLVDKVEFIFKPGESKMIVIRGIRFFNGIEELPLGSAKFLH